VVTPFIKTKAEWNSLVPNMPIFALLKNLATLERHGVLDDNKDLISKKFADGQVIGKSKILPFRFVEAEKHVNAGWVKDALRDATELAFDNVPSIEGKTEVLLDVSPSMQPMYSAFIKQAAPMAVAVAKKAGTGIVAFGGAARRFPVSQRDSLLTQAKQFVFESGRIHRESWTHGTNPSAAMDVLIQERTKADNLIILTDGEQNAGRSFSDALAEYLHKVNRKVRLFVIDVSPYNKAMVPINAPGCYYIYGWSDQVLQYISLTAAQDSMVKAIRDWDWKAKVAA
jgi:60 kDa SS-A/Ro ribonucleoprotein